MDIDRDKCVGCGNCHVICTMGAISLDEEGISVVNQDECVECSTCYRVLRDEGYRPWSVRPIRKILSFFKLGYLAEADLCPTGALTPPELAWPRVLRAQFSNPTIVHPGTGVPGRGTDEIKSNDVTGRLRSGEAGIVVEVGRPGIGAFFRDVEADLGICINISGLLEEVRECCRKAGIIRHSAEHSLGIWGAKDRLPEREVMEFNTMCGHGMVSFSLIRKMIKEVRLRRKTPKQAAKMMAKCCECGAFNPARAETLLARMRERGFLYSQK